jgi:hypothetical protein
MKSNGNRQRAKLYWETLKYRIDRNRLKAIIIDDSLWFTLSIIIVQSIKNIILVQCRYNTWTSTHYLKLRIEYDWFYNEKQTMHAICISHPYIFSFFSCHFHLSAILGSVSACLPVCLSVCLSVAQCHWWNIERIFMQITRTRLTRNYSIHKQLLTIGL